MRNEMRFGACVAITLGSLALGSVSADAAWWPFSKKNERNAEAAQQAMPPAAVPSQPYEPVPEQPVVTQPPVLVTPQQPVLTQPGDAAERLNNAEAQIRELNGQIEELTFQVRELRQTVEQVQAENEHRFNALEGGSVHLDDESQVFDDQPMDHIGEVVDSDGGAEAQPAPATAEQPLGRLVIDAPRPANADQPIDLTPSGAAPVSVRAAPGDAGEVRTRVASLGDPAADYEHAYSNILSGDYAMAEASFRSFLAEYPGDPRAPDAQYWLGESLFARGEYRDAADQFLSGYKAYPDSAKAPDTLLKLGLSLAGLGEREAACSTYAEVLKKYPQASNALRQRVSAEQAIASC